VQGTVINKNSNLKSTQTTLVVVTFSFFSYNFT
jgi:hypothetical protein